MSIQIISQTQNESRIYITMQGKRNEVKKRGEVAER